MIFTKELATHNFCEKFCSAKHVLTRKTTDQEKLFPGQILTYEYVDELLQNFSEFTHIQIFYDITLN